MIYYHCQRFRACSSDCFIHWNTKKKCPERRSNRHSSLSHPAVPTIIQTGKKKEWSLTFVTWPPIGIGWHKSKLHGAYHVHDLNLSLQLETRIFCLPFFVFLNYDHFIVRHCFIPSRNVARSHGKRDTHAEIYLPTTTRATWHGWEICKSVFVSSIRFPYANINIASNLSWER